MKRSTTINVDNGYKIFVNDGNMSFLVDQDKPKAKASTDEALNVSLHQKERIYAHDSVGDTRLIRCNDAGCPSNISKEEAGAIWDRFYYAGFIGRTSRGRYYLIDLAKEVYNKSPRYLNMWNQWSNLNIILNEIMEGREDYGKWMHKKVCDKYGDTAYDVIFEMKYNELKKFMKTNASDREKRIIGKIFGVRKEEFLHMKLGAHNLLKKYQELMKASHPGYGIDVFDGRNVFLDKENKYRMHDDPEYDSRNGDESVCCPLCGSPDVVIAPNGDLNIEHECVASDWTIVYDDNSDSLSKDAQAIGAQGYSIVHANNTGETIHVEDAKTGFKFVHGPQKETVYYPTDDGSPSDKVFKEFTPSDNVNNYFHSIDGDVYTPEIRTRNKNGSVLLHEPCMVPSTAEQMIIAWEEREMKRRQDKIDAYKEYKSAVYRALGTKTLAKEIEFHEEPVDTVDWM